MRRARNDSEKLDFLCGPGAPFRRLSALVYYVGWKRHLQFTDHCCFRHALRKNSGTHIMQTKASGTNVGCKQKGARHTHYIRGKNNTLVPKAGAHASWWRFVSILSSALKRFVTWYGIYGSWSAEPYKIITNGSPHCHLFQLKCGKVVWNGNFTKTLRWSWNWFHFSAHFFCFCNIPKIYEIWGRVTIYS